MSVSDQHGAALTGQILVIQYLRGFAASFVVLHHATQMTSVAGYFPRFGEFGVDIFFVVSGFIMWTTTSDGSMSTRDFWIARIIRIVPLYWFFLALFLVLSISFPSTIHVARQLDVVHIVKSFLFIPALDPNFKAVTPPYAPGWTLNYEMFFYLVFGLGLFIRQARLRLAFLVAVFVGLLAAGIVFRPSGPVLWFLTNYYLIEFLAGILLGVGRSVLMGRSRRTGLTLVVLSSVAFVGSYLVDDLALHQALFALGATAAVAGALPFEQAARAHPVALLKLLGDASYSVYLAHPFAQRAAFILLFQVPAGGVASIEGAIAYAVIAFVIGMAGGVLTYLWLERPILDRGRDLSRRFRRRDVAQVAAGRTHA